MATEQLHTIEDLDMELEVKAIRTIGTITRAWKWMDEPNAELDGAAPRDLLSSEAGRERLNLLLNDIGSGEQIRRAG